MSKCKQKIKQLFLKCDIFSTSEFLRYDCEPQYRTFTGAWCSIFTVVAFAVLFVNVIISTFAKTQVIWSLNTVELEAESFEVTTQVQGDDKFMFAIGVSGVDFSSHTRPFDTILLLKTKNNTISLPDININLQPCTESHWNVNQQVIQSYRRMNFTKMACPPIGLKIPIQGKFSSQIFKYAQIRIVSCSNQSNLSNCQIPSPSNTYYFNLYILNKLINPQSQQYISYYLEDRNYVQFTTTLTGLVNIFVSSYKITTDESIWPVTSSHQKVGGIINNLGQAVPRAVDSNIFASIILRRSSTAIIVDRGFKKIDDTLSYIGGLFGFVLIALIFMKQYTEYSFEIDASSHLYSTEDAQEQKKQQYPKFNFIIFLGYLVYLLLAGIGFQPNWQNMKSVDDSRQQIQKQLDVRFLFQRLDFIQRAMLLLFHEDQEKLLHLRPKPTIREASELRKRYQLRKKMKIQNNIETTDNPLDETSQNFSLPKHISKNSICPQSNENEFEIVSINRTQQFSKVKQESTFFKKKIKNEDNLSKMVIEDLNPNIVKIIHQSKGENESIRQNNKQDNISSQKMEKGYYNKNLMVNQLNKNKNMGFSVHNIDQKQPSQIIQNKSKTNLCFEYVN